MRGETAPPGSQMEAEFLQQPAVVSANCTRYFDELSRLCGCADVQMVLLAARYPFEIYLRLPVPPAASWVLTRFHSEVLYPKCLAIGIPLSGEAPDVGEVLNYMRRQGHFKLGITNTPNSPLEQTADFCLYLSAGAEESVAATKIYTASLSALYLARTDYRQLER